MGPNMMGPMMGQGMMGQGMMGMMGGMMGPGMMGQGYPGRGQMGPGYQGRGFMIPMARDLNVDEVRHMLEHRLAWQGNANLKLGEVEEADDDTITAEILTQDGSLVQRFEFDRHTGQMKAGRAKAGE
jgi:hypothetical protein